MSSIHVPHIDEETLRRLRQRAARHGVPVEEEMRRILNRAVSAPERLGDLARGTFGLTMAWIWSCHATTPPSRPPAGGEVTPATPTRPRA